MKPVKVRQSCELPLAAPVQLSKCVQTEKRMTSAQGSPDSERSLFSPEDHLHAEFIKEDPEHEERHFERTSFYVRYVAPLDQQHAGIHQTLIKEEPADGDYSCSETSRCGVDRRSEGFQDTPLKEEEDPEEDEFLYCEFCNSFYIRKCEIHGPALFLPDTPVPHGVSDRARQTLPPGLAVRDSPIPHAGLGVFNKGDTIPVGAHFGPYQGDVVEKEEAMESSYSWVIYKTGHCEKYIDGKKVTASNWMRYVNCADDKEASNLVAVQYQGQIFYRSSHPIKSRQELLVWYDEKYAWDLGATFESIWRKKCSVPGSGGCSLDGFSCSLCSLFHKTQIDLHKHIQKCHDENISVLRSDGLKDEPRNRSHAAFGSGKPSRMATELYCCSQCGKRFAGRRNLKQHQRIHTGERPFLCPQCGKRFARQSHLRAHQSIHTGEKLHPCSQCGKRFNRESTLQQHRRIHTGEKPYQCSECGKSFTYLNALQRHHRIHTGEKPFTCSQCGKSFAYHSALQLHQHVHTGEKPYICSVCGKSFRQSNSLQSHQLVHSGEKPYPCSQCGKVFLQQNNLQIHQRIHTGEKPFHCGQCGKSFNLESTLQRHRRTHTGERPYRCSQCDKSFARLCHLKRHEQIHTGEKPYECSQCGKDFNRESSLQRHLLTHTGEKLYSCAQCGKNFTRRSNLKIHQLIHSGEKASSLH